MKRTWFYRFSALVILFVCLFCFTGCFSSKELAKASKNLTSYDIDVTINEGDMSALIKEKVNVINKRETILDTLCFNVYSRAFREDAEVKPYTIKNEGKVFPNGTNYGDGKINSVKVNGVKKNFNFDGDSDTAIVIKLDKPLEINDRVEVELEVLVLLTNSTHRLSYYNGTISLGNFFPILAVYENGEYISYPYHSTGDPFYSDLANFSVNVHYPSEYVFNSTGEVVSSSQNESTKTTSVKALAVRDFAINLCKKAKKISKLVNKTEISYTGYEGDEDLDANLQTAIKAYNYFSKTFGAYPYKTLSVVKAPFVHGGMEYPNMVIIADSVIESFDKAKVIVHEIAHQWWYGLVGNNQVTEAWVDEAMSEYSSVLFFEAHQEYGATYEELISEAFSLYTLYQDIVKNTSNTLNTSMTLPSYEYSSEYEYSYMIYIRGTLMFDTIRQAIGKEKLLKCFKAYFKDYKFKTATGDMLIECFRKTSKRNIEEVFDNFLSGAAVIGGLN